MKVVKEEIILSVIVPSFNSNRFIRECLESLRQEYVDGVEYLLIDGGSADSTMTIVREFNGLFAAIISEKDGGQSDAINKGFSMATGRYFTWLNSDDALCPGALALIVRFLKRKSGLWYSANYIYVDADSKVVRCCQSSGFQRAVLRFGVLSVYGPSSIIHRDLFREAGRLRTDFHYCMDVEYWWRFVQMGHQYEKIPVYLWALRLHDGAKTASAVDSSLGVVPARMKEEAQIIKKTYYPKTSYLDLKYGIYLARCLRVINFSLVWSMVHTLKYKEQSVREFPSASRFFKARRL